MKRYFRRPIIEILFVFGLAALLSRCGGGNEMAEKNIWARPAVAGQNSAVYFDVDNATNQDDLILEVRGDVAEAIEVHMSKMDKNGVMSMERQESVSVPAKSAVEFKPGGLHVMLINLRDELEIGDTFELTLVFQNAGEVTISVPVREP
jgi:copper(I)-binding protein